MFPDSPFLYQPRLLEAAFDCYHKRLILNLDSHPRIVTSISYGEAILLNRKLDITVGQTALDAERTRHHALPLTLCAVVAR